MKNVYGIEDRWIQINEYPFEIRMKHYLRFYEDEGYSRFMNAGWTAEHPAG